MNGKREMENGRGGTRGNPSPLEGEGGDGGMNAHSRQLRKNMTPTERALWRYLRLRQFEGFKFRRQQPIGRYIVDFVCLEKRLVIEVDGGQHDEQAGDDAKRDTWLRSNGFCVLRFWNIEVLKEMEMVKQRIWEALISPPPPSSPARGEARGRGSAVNSR